MSRPPTIREAVALALLGFVALVLLCRYEDRVLADECRAVGLTVYPNGWCGR